jgi:RNA-directed DNA polymerase
LLRGVADIVQSILAKEQGKRKLGIPTVADRIAQMVAKMYLEPQIECYFHRDSYGYRPYKSALDAIGKARQRCWKLDWVVDLDILLLLGLRYELLKREQQAT